MIIQQISVFLENREGQLAQIVQELARHGVDLRAIHIAETADYGVLRFIAGDPQKAAQVLLEQQFVVSMTPVVAVEVPDQPGGLAALVEKVTGAGVDIEYMYSMLVSHEGSATMVFRVKDPERLEAQLAAGAAPTSRS